MADNNRQAGQSRGNRPAENARHATPASLSSQANWQGSGTAEDFLGLNEVEAPPQVQAQVPAQVPSQAPARTPAKAPPTRAADSVSVQPGDESWLMDDGTSAAGSEPVTTFVVHDEDSDEEEQVESHKKPGVHSAPSVLDASWTEDRPQRRASKRPLLALGACVIVLAASGSVFMLKKSKAGHGTNSATEIAEAPAIAVKPAPEPTPPPTVVLEIPKPSNPGAAARNSATGGRRAVDRSGHTEPNPVAETPTVETNSSPIVEAKPPPAVKEPATEVAVVTPPVEHPTALRPKFEPLGREPQSGNAGAPKFTPIAPASKAPATNPTEVPKPPATGPLNVTSGPPPPAPLSSAPVILAPAPPTIAVNTQPIAPQVAPNVPGAVSSVPSTVESAPPATAVASVEHPRPPLGAPESTPEGASAAAQPVRVLAAATAPLAAASGAKPTVDEHPSAVPTQPVATDPAVTPEAAVAGDENAPVHPPSVVSRAGSIPANDVLLPAAPLNGVRAAQAEDLLSMWTADTVPLDRVDSKTKVMTPNVGEVRVTLKSKDVFEGRLYAVGEKSIWLEGPFGRMGLEYSRVEKIDKLAVAPKPGAPGAKAPAVGEVSDRVRVKTPTGQVLGRVLSTDGLTSKIVTDDGLKMTVDNKDLEFVDQAPKIKVKKDAPRG